GPDVRALAGHQTVSRPEALRREDVALLPVHVVEQRDARAPVRVVLDVRDLGRHAVLVPAEVNRAVPPLRAASLVPGRDPPLGVPPGALAPLGQERLLGTVAGELVEPGDARSASPGAGRLVLAN